jgi:hypothetical protein
MIDVYQMFGSVTEKKTAKIIQTNRRNAVSCGIWISEEKKGRCYQTKMATSSVIISTRIDP